MVSFLKLAAVTLPFGCAGSVTAVGVGVLEELGVAPLDVDVVPVAPDPPHAARSRPAAMTVMVPRVRMGAA
jgi:hypothetical protein